MNAEDLFVQHALAAGLEVVDADGIHRKAESPAERAIARAQAEAGRAAQQTLPSIIPIEPAISAYTLVVQTMDGEEYRLHPKLRWGTLTEAIWYDQQIDKRAEEIDAETDVERVRALRDDIHRLEHAKLALSIPNLPDGFLLRLDQVQVAHINAVIRRMTLDGQKVVNDLQKKILAPYMVADNSRTGASLPPR